MISQADINLGAVLTLHVFFFQITLQTWALYERGELEQIVDTSLNDDFDAEEACKYLKVGLLCTQDNPKLRPAMSAVVMMLIGEKDVSEQIMKPGLISDFMDLKIKHQKVSEDFMDQKIKHQKMSVNMFPASTSLEASTVSSMTTTNMSVTFTSTADHA